MGKKGPTTIRCIQPKSYDTQLKVHRTKCWRGTSLSLESRMAAANLIQLPALKVSIGASGLVPFADMLFCQENDQTTCNTIYSKHQKNASDD